MEQSPNHKADSCSVEKQCIQSIWNTIIIIVIIIISQSTLLTYSIEQSPSWEANQWTLPLVKKFPAFMEPESSSPYPQVTAIRPYTEPTPSSPHDPLQLPEDPS